MQFIEASATTEVSVPTDVDVKAIRGRLNMAQSKFSDIFGLAAEIEWSSWGPSKGERRDLWVRDRVGEDFGKLTIIKCPIKLMVFCTDPSTTEHSHGPMQQVVLDEIDRYLKIYAHHIPGDSLQHAS
jgi:hypothetical protein